MTRAMRGLFQSSSGLTINADINGSLNILRKVAGDALFDTNNGKLVEGYAVSPDKVLLYKKLYDCAIYKVENIY